MAQAMSSELEELVAEAAKLHATLEGARQTKDQAEATINAVIVDYVSAKQRITNLTDAMVRLKAETL